MSLIHVLLDSSAAIKEYRRQEPGARIIRALFKKTEIAKHLPNVCIPEVMSAIFSLQIEKQLDETEVQEVKGRFIKDILSHKIIIHDIGDRDIKGTDEINEFALGWYKRAGKDPTTRELIAKGELSGIDTLVISICREMQKQFKKSVFLFTSDDLMRSVALHFRLFAIDPRGIRNREFNLFAKGEWPTSLGDIWPQAPKP